ncbi:hypothetical protein [Allocoleopsis franciscana]|nr:hypothetical protein [Allocoleopsis franciscana]
MQISQHYGKYHDSGIYIVEVYTTFNFNQILKAIAQIYLSTP